jgi:hypothetical protein
MRRPVSGRDAVRSQVIDVLEAQIKDTKETGNEQAVIQERVRDGTNTAIPTPPVGRCFVRLMPCLLIMRAMGIRALRARPLILDECDPNSTV